MGSSEWLELMLYEGGMGLEEENQRVTSDGFLTSSAHPFDDPRLDRDFCESQLEMITGVSHSVVDVVNEVWNLRRRASQKLLQMPDGDEYLWRFSNPPYIRSDDDIHVAQFAGEKAEKTVYRNHLAQVYGKRVQTLCGIHFNYSYPEKFTEYLKQENIDPDIVYLSLAEQLVKYSWLIVSLTAASPVVDGSYSDSADLGTTVYGEYSSLRCSERGYWNEFLPVLSFTDIDSYIDSINAYVRSGALYSASELYYPIRLKPAGANTLERLRNGINHIELRMLDVNPLYTEGVGRNDLTFIVILIAYITDQIINGRTSGLTPAEQQKAIDNMKSAAHYPLENVNILHEKKIYPLTEAAIKILDDIGDWAGDKYRDVIGFEKDKITDPSKRYAQIVIDRFGNDFVRSGLKYLKGED